VFRNIRFWRLLHWCAKRAHVNKRCLRLRKLAVFFSRAILAAENKPPIVHVKLFTRLLDSDLVRQLQCLGFEILIIPFHCHSPLFFGNFGTALLLYHSIPHPVFQIMNYVFSLLYLRFYF
ncbi:MAG: hypothetical protein ACTTKL_06605, partial [Treponema sp.]